MEKELSHSTCQYIWCLAVVFPDQINNLQDLDDKSMTLTYQHSPIWPGSQTEAEKTFLLLPLETESPGSQVNRWNFAIQMATEQTSGLTWAAGNVLASFLEIQVGASPCLNHQWETLSLYCFKTRLPTEVNPTRRCKNQ